MKHDLNTTVALLERTPASLDALLRGLPEVWTHSNEGQNTWRAFDVLGHLIYGERADWMPRVHIILRFGETKTFEPFDRMGHVSEIKGKTLDNLLDEFTRMRAEKLAELKALNLSAADLQRRGRHPSQGIVTLSELLAAWAVHDLTHLHQISRIMAAQYRDAVGGWSPFLGVLQCNGHSASD